MRFRKEMSMVNLRTAAENLWRQDSGRGDARNLEAIKAAGYDPNDFARPGAWGTQWNEFRVCDALEFARAYDWTRGKSKEEIQARLKSLCDRMETIMAEGKEAGTYLLAAMRGYEYALIDESRDYPPAIVKLNDAAPDMVAREAWFAESR
jgi:hypothetical protein